MKTIFGDKIQRHWLRPRTTRGRDAESARKALARRVSGDEAIETKFVSSDEGVGTILTHIRAFYSHIDVLEQRIARLEKE